jgi:hypothetical protein
MSAQTTTAEVSLKRKPGRPRKYRTREERLAAQAACMRRLREEQDDTGDQGKIGAYEKRWGTEFIPLSFPPRYKDGRGEISPENFLRGMAKNL